MDILHSTAAAPQPNMSTGCQTPPEYAYSPEPGIWNTPLGGIEGIDVEVTGIAVFQRESNRMSIDEV